ncbi:hypothetical protein [Microbacterium sp.]|uniref:DUF7507 domain-containing protein n=1 Tax=Microbacterium sp. TaxID=51671 RepID=UPI0039E225F8
MRTSEKGRSAGTTLRRRIAQLASTALALGGIGLAGLAAAAPAAAADPEGCSYGEGGPHAETICWLDFSAFDQADAADGQHFTIPLPGGYQADFDLTWDTLSGSGSPGARSAPTWSGSVFGRDVYVGVTGRPALTSGASSTTRYTLSDISVTDPNGEDVTGYSMLTMDAEAMGPIEGITWNSDQPFYQVGDLVPTGYGCAVPDGLGTTEVICYGGQNGAPIVAATDATWISADVDGGGVQDVVFGFEFTKLELRKVFTELVDPADAVDLSITTPAGTNAGSASTDGALSATTDDQTLLPVGEFTLAEAVSDGSDMVADNYTSSWSCENSAESDTELPSGEGVTKTVTPAPGDAIVCTITNTPKVRSLALVKEAGDWTDVNDDGLLDAGDLQHYTFTVTNDGELELHGLEVTDPLAGATTCEATTLAPDESTVCRTVEPYEITPADVTAGGVENTATASALPPGSENPEARISTTGSVTTPTTTPAPALSVVKTSDHAEAGAAKPGDVVTYTFTVENTGNVPVLDVAIAEGEFTGTGELSPATCEEGAARLLPEATVECTATYVLTQEDVDAGSVSNTATATGTDPDGGDVASGESSTEVEIVADPAFTFEKLVDVGTARSAGDTIAYRFVVTNTGNVTLTDYAVTEGTFTGTNDLSAIVCPDEPLAAGDEAVCTASYVLSAADVKAGSVDNTASAAVVPARGEAPASASSSAHAVIPDLLAVTGALVPWFAATIGALLLGAGVLLSIRRRSELG